MAYVVVIVGIMLPALISVEVGDTDITSSVLSKTHKLNSNTKKNWYRILNMSTYVLKGGGQKGRWVVRTSDDHHYLLLT